MQDPDQPCALLRTRRKPAPALARSQLLEASRIAGAQAWCKPAPIWRAHDAPASLTCDAANGALNRSLLIAKTGIPHHRHRIQALA
jgi:hypothetical protein